MRDVDHPRLQRAEGRQLGELERRAAARADDAAAAPATPVLAPEAPATPQAWHDEAPRTPPRAVPAWHAVEQPDADGAFESRLDANGDIVMRVGPAKRQKRARFETQLDTQLLEQTRLPIQLSEQTRLAIQLLEQTRLDTQLLEQTRFDTQLLEQA